MTTAINAFNAYVGWVYVCVSAVTSGGSVVAMFLTMVVASTLIALPLSLCAYVIVRQETIKLRMPSDILMVFVRWSCSFVVEKAVSPSGRGTAPSSADRSVHPSRMADSKSKPELFSIKARILWQFVGVSSVY